MSFVKFNNLREKGLRQDLLGCLNFDWKRHCHPNFWIEPRLSESCHGPRKSCQNGNTALSTPNINMWYYILVCSLFSALFIHITYLNFIYQMPKLESTTCTSCLLECSPSTSNCRLQEFLDREVGTQALTFQKLPRSVQPGRRSPRTVAWPHGPPYH